MQHFFSTVPSDPAAVIWPAMTWSSTFSDLSADPPVPIEVIPLTGSLPAQKQKTVLAELATDYGAEITQLETHIDAVAKPAIAAYVATADSKRAADFARTDVAASTFPTAYSHLAMQTWVPGDSAVTFGVHELNGKLVTNFSPLSKTRAELTTMTDADDPR